MALFARKNKNAPAANDPNGTAVANAVATPPDTSSNGAVVNGAAVNGAAFSSDDEDALFKKAAGRKGRKSNKPTRVSRGLKGGAVVGLNIGNESIKAVELRGKGLDVAVTAVGSIATPPDCLSNGVILNPVSLSSALRDLFVQNGIKSRNVISSVSGSGALVVRVLEVARMSDAELAEHMNTDLERYVPFPPNEVVKDYRPLRELPTDPDAPNMEVLLAAAQNEVIDQHLAVLKDAKIEPQAIDVEPLAAARAIFYDANNSEPVVDYNAATAVVNIGATNTEISVLRGDILVFTRSVPIGGQALTQALCDTLGMAWPDAEQTKFEMGDALPPHSGETPTATDDNDWSAFGDDTQDANGDADPFSSGFYNDGPNADGEPNGSDPQVQQHQKQDGDEQTPNANSESGAKEPRLPDFDLTRFNFSEEEGEVDEAIPTTPVEASDEGESGVENGEGFAPKPVSVADVAAAISTMSSGRAVPVSPDIIAPATSSTRSDFDNSLLPAIDDVNAQNANRDAASAPVFDEDDTSRLPGVLDFPMAGEDEGLSGMAPSGQMYGMDSPEDPDLISFPTLPTGLIAAGRESDMVYGEDALPTMTDEDDETSPRANEQNINFPSIAALIDVSPGQFGETPTSSADAGNVADSAPNTQTPFESVFDFSDTSAPAAPIDDFESAFADMIGDAPSTSTVPGASATIATPSVSPSAFAMDATLAPEQSDFDLDQFATPSSGSSDSFGIDDFGFGMAGGDSGALTPLKVYEVLQPRLQELVAEIRRSLEYFASRYPDAGVQRIVLVGGGARLPNMDAMLTQEIGIPTVIDRPLSRLKLQVPNLPSDFVDEQGATFAVATGLALRDLVS